MLRTVTDWGLYPKVRAEVAEPSDLDALKRQAAEWDHFIARGAGLCYGDAALSDKIISTLNLNTIYSLDPSSGFVDCEAGVRLVDILRLSVPAGWFFRVTPGIKSITVGGAIASDVHGKNHPDQGCFSNWLESFELLRADGSVTHCSKTENADLFWQTCGGMGWTGVILRARFQLRRIRSTEMRQKTVRARHLEEVFEAFTNHQHSEYAVAWVDCLPKGNEFGRGAVHFGDHVESPAPVLEWQEPKPANVPFFMPSFTLNPWTIRLHNNHMYKHIPEGERKVYLDSFFYPLDRIRNWNRLYGRRGFIQYQFCLPEAVSFEGIRKILEVTQQSGDLPFLTVLKRHGERPAEAIHSFPIRGYSLALDFPRTRTVFNLVRRLDELVLRYDGRIYLTKDACSAAPLGRVDPRTFGDAKFHSLLKERILHG